MSKRIPPETRHRLAYQHELKSVIRRFEGENYQELPKGLHGENCHEKMDMRDVAQIVAAIRVYLDFPGGSIHGGDLYQIMNAVLLDPEKSREIGAIARRKPSQSDERITS